MSMKIMFSRLVLQSVFYKIIRLSSSRAQTCVDIDKSDGKLDGIAESTIEGKLDGKRMDHAIENYMV